MNFCEQAKNKEWHWVLIANHTRDDFKFEILHLIVSCISLSYLTLKSLINWAVGESLNNSSRIHCSNLVKKPRVNQDECVISSEEQILQTGSLREKAMRYTESEHPMSQGRLLIYQWQSAREVGTITKLNKFLFSCMYTAKCNAADWYSVECHWSH